MKEFFIFIIVILVIVAIFYGIYILGVKGILRSAKKFDEVKLIKVYNQTVKKQRLIWSIISFFLFGFAAIFFYYLFKKQHEIMQNELESRNIKFEYKE